MNEPLVPSFRQATLGDAPAILELLEASFERWPGFDIPVPAMDHLLWKMQPPGIEPNHTVGEVDGQIVALELRWMGPALLDGREVVTNDGVDMAVHPDWQGRRFSRLINDAPSRLPQPGDLGIDTPSRNPRLVNSTYIGDRNLTERFVNTWVLSFALRTMLAVDFRTGGLSQMLRRLPRIAERTLRKRRTGEVRVATGYAIDELQDFDQRANVLWEAACDRFDVARLRRASYLNWRYADPRSGNSLILGALRDQALVGYVVFRLSGDIAVLADILTHPAHDVGPMLVATGVARMRALGSQQITAWLAPEHPDEPALKSAGFLNINRPVTVQLDEPPGRTGMTGIDIERFDDPGLRMHVTAGDFDFV
jgi:hypothetical protein